MSALFSALTNWLLFTALVVASGAVVALLGVVPRAARAHPASAGVLADVARATAAAAATLLPVAMALVFARQLVEFRDPFATWGEDARLLLTGTPWGGTWMRAVLASVVAAVGLRLGRRGRAPAFWIGAAALAGLLAYPALSGHAAGTGELVLVTLAADTVHVLAAGAWIGGLVFVLRAERAWRRGEVGEPDSLLPLLVPLFSPVAVAAVTLLAATGLLAAWVQLPDLASLATTAYGRTLVVKLLLVAGVGALGAYNWRVLTPRLDGEAGRSALRRTAAAELLVGQLVLLATAVLVRLPPTGH